MKLRCTIFGGAVKPTPDMIIGATGSITLEVELDDNATTEDLKQQLFEKTKLSPDSLHILCAGRALKPNNGLKNQRVRNGSRLHITVKARQEMEAERPPPLVPVSTAVQPTPVVEKSSKMEIDEIEVKSDPTQVNVSISRGVVKLDEETLCHVYAWGTGANGRLGTGSAADCNMPTGLSGLKGKRFVQVGCGGLHSVLINEDGEAYFFGCYWLPEKDQVTYSTNQQGRGFLPQGHPAGAGALPAAFGGGPAPGGGLPIAFGPPPPAGMVPGRGIPGLGLPQLPGGGAGRGRPAKRGFTMGNRGNQMLSMKLPRLNQVRVTNVACGNFHSLLLTDIGEVFSFGQGVYGQLGHNNRFPTRYPQKVEELAPFQISSVAAGGSHSICLDEKHGFIWTFGRGSHGQLGHGDKEDKLTPCLVKKLVANKEKITKVDGGGAFTVAVCDSSKSIYFWGAQRILEPQQIPYFEGQTIRCLSSKGNSIAVVTEQDGLFVWQADQEVGGPNQDLKSLGIKHVDCGVGFVAVLLRSGAVYTFGTNASGQCGQGVMTEAQSTIKKPALVNGLLGKNVTAVSCGNSHTIALSDFHATNTDFLDLFLSELSTDVDFICSDGLRVRGHQCVLSSLPSDIRHILLNYDLEELSSSSCQSDAVMNDLSLTRTNSDDLPLGWDDQETDAGTKYIRIAYSSEVLKVLLRYLYSRHNQTSSMECQLNVLPDSHEIIVEIMHVLDVYKTKAKAESPLVSTLRAHVTLRSQLLMQNDAKIRLRQELLQKYKFDVEEEVHDAVVAYMEGEQDQDMDGGEEEQQSSTPQQRFGILHNPDMEEQKQAQKDGELNKHRLEALERLTRNVFQDEQKARTDQTRAKELDRDARRKAYLSRNAPHESSQSSNTNIRGQPKQRFSEFGVFSEMLERQTFCDIKFQIGDELLPAHKAILMTRSRYFYSMFKVGLLESQESVMTISRAPPNVFKALLQFLYTGRCTAYPPDIPTLIRLSSEYQLLALLELIQHFLITQIQLQNVLELYKLSSYYQMYSLREQCLCFILSEYTRLSTDIAQFDEALLAELKNVRRALKKKNK